MSYQPYPGGTQMPEPATRPPVPQSITRAVQLMYAGAAASLIGIIIALTTLSSIKSQIISRNPSLTATQVNNAEHHVVVRVELGRRQGVGGLARRESVPDGVPCQDVDDDADEAGRGADVHELHGPGHGPRDGWPGGGLGRL